MKILYFCLLSFQFIRLFQNEKLEDKNIHMKDMSSETCFIPTSFDNDVDDERLMADTYSFITECFFMAHKAIDLGYRVGVDKLIKQNIVSNLF